MDTGVSPRVKWLEKGTNNQPPPSVGLLYLYIRSLTAKTCQGVTFTLYLKEGLGWRNASKRICPRFRDSVSSYLYAVSPLFSYFISPLS